MCENLDIVHPDTSNQNQIKIYIAPYVHEDSEALGGWITCSRRVGIDEFLHVFLKDSKLILQIIDLVIQ